MPLPPRPALLDKTLRIVARRYRVPATLAGDTDPSVSSQRPCATRLAVAIDQARQALARATTPPASVKQCFIDALAQLIHEAMRPDQGDPAIQAMVLRHQAPQVREYASLSAGAEADRRDVVAAVNATAHPAKLERMPPGPLRTVLARLQAAASAASWPALAAAVPQLESLGGAASGPGKDLADGPANAHDNAAVDAPDNAPDNASANAPDHDPANDPALARSLSRLRDGAALERLQRLDELALDPWVRRYQALWNRNGPRSGSPGAVAQGVAAQQRGAAVEARASQALQALADRLNAAPEGNAAYRVVTSMRVPPALPGDADRAKSEWDAALLRRVDAPSVPNAPVAPAAQPAAWDVCLLVEAKASVDAASTDFARLLRGLARLAQAESGMTYPFHSHQGAVPIRGASLAALPTGETDLSGAVLYCSDAPADPAPRLLNAACRMQLLSAPASVAYASELARGRPADTRGLDAVWQSLLTSPQWAGVLNQYPQLYLVRELMVHADDLLAAAQQAAM
ncbi:3-deoxy-D-arabino-heptulosonate 7-phosphate synthase [Achromobacter sp. AGC39]